MKERHVGTVLAVLLAALVMVGTVAGYAYREKHKPSTGPLTCGQQVSAYEESYYDDHGTGPDVREIDNYRKFIDCN